MDGQTDGRMDDGWMDERMDSRARISPTTTGPAPFWTEGSDVSINISISVQQERGHGPVVLESNSTLVQ